MEAHDYDAALAGGGMEQDAAFGMPPPPAPHIAPQPALTPDMIAVLVAQQVQHAMQPAHTAIASMQHEMLAVQQQAAASAQAAAQAAAQPAPQMPPPPAAASSSRLKPVKPDAYNGRPENDVDTFLFSVNQYCLQQGETSEEAQIRYAGSMLRGAAATWWRGHISAHPLPATWDAFTTLMRSQFQPIDRVKLARDRIATLRQDRSVRDYTFKFRSLLLEIPGMSADEQLDRYVRGLKPAVRKEVEIKNPTTLDAANRIAEIQDANAYRVFGPSNNRPSYSNGPRRSYASAVRDTPVPMELGAMRARLPPRPKLAQPRPFQRNRDVLNNACFYCHKTGHRLNDCPERRRQPSPGLAPAFSVLMA